MTKIMAKPDDQGIKITRAGLLREPGSSGVWGFPSALPALTTRLGIVPLYLIQPVQHVKRLLEVGTSHPVAVHVELAEERLVEDGPHRLTTRDIQLVRPLQEIQRALQEVATRRQPPLRLLGCPLDALLLGA
ncbi:hypothetical protein ACFOY4_37140 [Actinomadura syzygii]|uniref:hypothetical protein n=1 Tax=Actinomadura syzygii TaxID=1427538 RepID=UPI001FE41F06|nr:hypothetical protein [Actinomadura syzygii]